MRCPLLHYPLDHYNKAVFVLHTTFGTAGLGAAHTRSSWRHLGSSHTHVGTSYVLFGLNQVFHLGMRRTYEWRGHQMVRVICVLFSYSPIRNNITERLRFTIFSRYSLKRNDTTKNKDMQYVFVYAVSSWEGTFKIIARRPTRPCQCWRSMTHPSHVQPKSLSCNWCANSSIISIPATLETLQKLGSAFCIWCSITGCSLTENIFQLN